MLPEAKGTLFSGGAMVFSYGSKDLEIRMCRPAQYAITSSNGEQAPEAVFPEENVSPEHARTLLGLLLQDAATRPAAEALVRDPPDDAQRSPEVIVAAAVVLGALIGWLQTQVEIYVSLKGGEMDSRFNLKKEASDKDVISQVAGAISSLLRGG